MQKGFTKIPNFLKDIPLSPEAGYLYMWLSLWADKNGQVTTSRADLSKRTGLSQRQVRTAIEKLEATKVVTKVATKGTTKVATILTVSFLASCETKSKTSDQSCDQTSDQSRAYKNDIFNHSIEEEKKPTTNVVGKEKPDVAPATTLSKGLSLEERQVKFYDTLRPYVTKYPAEMLRAFYDYWSEPNRSRTKFRQELEKTWDLPRRLATWNKREKERKFNNGKYHTTDSAAETVDAAAAAIAELIADNR